MAARDMAFPMENRDQLVMRLLHLQHVLPGVVRLPRAGCGWAYGNVVGHYRGTLSSSNSLDEHKSITVRQYDRPRRHCGAGQAFFSHPLAINNSANGRRNRLA